MCECMSIVYGIVEAMFLDLFGIRSVYGKYGSSYTTAELSQLRLARCTKLCYGMQLRHTLCKVIKLPGLAPVHQHHACKTTL